MAIDPLARGLPSERHVSLRLAGEIARGRRSSARAAPAAEFRPETSPPPRVHRDAPIRPRRSLSQPSPGSSPHTPVSTANALGGADRWDSLLNRLGSKYNVPPLFLKAVMLAESGGRPDAVGDDGHSVGLFQLHDQGYGAGMGDRRFDPDANAERAARGLAEAWHVGERAGYTGEYAVRAAYDYSFNPGGGFAYQGDAVVHFYNDLLAEQGLPPLH